MWLLHMGDLHLAVEKKSKSDLTKILNLMYGEIRNTVKNMDNLIVTICGDITSQGTSDGYDLASQFFDEMKQLFHCSLPFCLCPGNHDVSKDDKDFFTNFNKFSWYLTKSDNFIFSRERTINEKVIKIDDEQISIISINSSYHGDTRHGFIKQDDLVAILEKSDSNNKIVLIHHHFIPVENDNKSSVKNAYQFISLLSKYNIKLVLHGHAHMENNLCLGRNNCIFISSGSLFSTPKTNYNNQFILVKYEQGQLKEAYRYKYISDAHKDGRVGNFEKFVMDIF